MKFKFLEVCVRVYPYKMFFTFNYLKLFWLLINIIIFLESYYYYATKPEFYYLREMLGAGFLISRASACILNVNCFLVLLPICRFINSYLHFTFRFSSINRTVVKCWLHNVQILHKMFGFTIIVASVIHTAGHTYNAVNASVYFNKRFTDINWAFFENENPFIMITRTISGTSGLLMFLILLIMSAFSLEWFRKNDFILFSTAHSLFMPFMILYLIHPLSKILKEQINYFDHIPGCALTKNCTAEPVFKPISLQNWKWITPAISIYIIDLVYRMIMRNKLYFVVKELKKYPGNVYKLTLRGNRKIQVYPAQYILLQCPKISSIEWHPFTVLSCANYEYELLSDISVFIRICGDWTNTLANYLELYHATRCIYASNVAVSNVPALRFLIDGSFYSPLSNILKADIAFCVATGIGITPFVSVLSYLNECWDTYKNPYRFHLIWIVPSLEYFLWFEELLCNVHNKNWKSNKPDRLEYKFYVTKETDHSKIKNIIKNPLLQNRIHLGKPDWSDVLQTWHSFYYKSPYSLYVCGSPKLTKNIEKVCTQLSKKNIIFKCVYEAFS